MRSSFIESAEAGSKRSLQDYFTLGERVEYVPPIVPFEAFCAPLDQEPDPVSLVDSAQVLPFAKRVRLKVIGVSDSPDSWRESASKGYVNHTSCIEKAHQRMTALGIPRNR